MSSEKRKIMLADLMRSVQSSQPIRAGSGGGEPMWINFLTWASKNLSRARAGARQSAILGYNLIQIASFVSLWA